MVKVVDLAQSNSNIQLRLFKPFVSFLIRRIYRTNRYLKGLVIHFGNKYSHTSFLGATRITCFFYKGLIPKISDYFHFLLVIELNTTWDKTFTDSSNPPNVHKWLVFKTRRGN